MHKKGEGLPCGPSRIRIEPRRYTVYIADAENNRIALFDKDGEPLGELKVIPDFLPSPEALAFREEGVKVTIALSKRSIEFFKREAAKHGTQYQRMIRRLLDTYASHHSRPLTSRSTRTRGKSSRAG